MIGQTENGLMVYLGEGDVLVNTGRQPDSSFENEVIFSQDDAPHEVGAITLKHAGQPSTVLTTPIRLQFLKIESIDVVMSALRDVRASMIAANAAASAASV